MPENANRNGLDPQVEPLRIVFIGPSIRSDWNNPAAHMHRNVIEELNKQGHSTSFLEERRNQAVEGLLAEQGADALTAFDREFPTIDYRSYDPPPSRELRIWIGREGATADVLILLAGMSEIVVEAFERTSVLELKRLIERPDGSGSVLVDLDRDTPVVRYSFSDEQTAADAEMIARAIEQSTVPLAAFD